VLPNLEITKCLCDKIFIKVRPLPALALSVQHDGRYLVPLTVRGAEVNNYKTI
jgi:hypothetical protein